MPRLFSYGSLQQEEVQLSTFGRKLDGTRNSGKKCVGCRVDGQTGDASRPQATAGRWSGFEQHDPGMRTELLNSKQRRKTRNSSAQDRDIDTVHQITSRITTNERVRPRA